jgi:hypothetical protein
MIAPTLPGGVAADGFRKAGAEAFEPLEDMVAEVRAETAAEQAAAGAAGAAGRSCNRAASAGIPRSTERCRRRRPGAASWTRRGG